MAIIKLHEAQVAIIGLGYVGLPLAVEFGQKQKVFGFDVNKERIEELGINEDRTLEVTKEDLLAATHLEFTSNYEDLAECNVYIVTVPTPIDEYKRPDLMPLK